MLKFRSRLVGEMGEEYFTRLTTSYKGERGGSEREREREVWKFSAMGEMKKTRASYQPERLFSCNTFHHTASKAATCPSYHHHQYKKKHHQSNTVCIIH